MFLSTVVVVEVVVTVVLVVAVVIGACVVETKGSWSIWTITYASRPSARIRPSRRR